MLHCALGCRCIDTIILPIMIFCFNRYLKLYNLNLKWIFQTFTGQLQYLHLAYSDSFNVWLSCFYGVRLSIKRHLRKMHIFPLYMIISELCLSGCLSVHLLVCVFGCPYLSGYLSSVRLCFCVFRCPCLSGCLSVHVLQGLCVWTRISWDDLDQM